MANEKLEAADNDWWRRFFEHLYPNMQPHQLHPLPAPGGPWASGPLLQLLVRTLLTLCRSLGGFETLPDREDDAPELEPVTIPEPMPAEEPELAPV